ncbi:hypothetical protein PENTCL1PPCAC_947, partial [Pristionchus entomophagus]
RSQDLDAVIMLLSHGVDVNRRDRKNLTALHYAIRNEYLLITKTLILFEADHTIVLNDNTKDEVKEVVDNTHLLSLDGGGIRGLVLTTILAEIEREIPDFLDRVQWTAGTSTGSILSLALSQGKTIGDCRNIYFKFK